MYELKYHIMTNEILTVRTGLNVSWNSSKFAALTLGDIIGNTNTMGYHWLLLDNKGCRTPALGFLDTIKVHKPACFSDK